MNEWPHLAAARAWWQLWDRWIKLRVDQPGTSSTLRDVTELKLNNNAVTLIDWKQDSSPFRHANFHLMLAGLVDLFFF